MEATELPRSECNRARGYHTQDWLSLTRSLLTSSPHHSLIDSIYQADLFLRILTFGRTISRKVAHVAWSTFRFMVLRQSCAPAVRSDRKEPPTARSFQDWGSPLRVRKGLLELFPTVKLSKIRSIAAAGLGVLEPGRSINRRNEYDLRVTRVRMQRGKKFNGSHSDDSIIYPWNSEIH